MFIIADELEVLTEVRKCGRCDGTGVDPILGREGKSGKCLSCGGSGSTGAWIGRKKERTTLEPDRVEEVKQEKA